MVVTTRFITIQTRIGTDCGLYFVYPWYLNNNNTYLYSGFLLSNSLYTLRMVGVFPLCGQKQTQLKSSCHYDCFLVLIMALPNIYIALFFGVNQSVIVERFVVYVIMYGIHFSDDVCILFKICCLFKILQKF